MDEPPKSFANPFYPEPLASRERTRVEQRRRGISPPPASDEAPGGNDYLGLALSGGGIRSATFCLGVSQELAKRGLLRRFDFMSTVSGGGFLGGFLGAWTHRSNIREVESGVADDGSIPVRFLRENGRYIAPNGAGDAGVALASYLRGWMAALATMGLLTLAFLMVAAAVQETALVRMPPDYLPKAFQPGGLRPWLWLSPWWLAPYACIFLFAVPLGITFWLLGTKPLRVTPPIWGFLLITAALRINYFLHRSVGSWRPVFTDGRGIVGIGLFLLATACAGKAFRIRSRIKFVLLCVAAVIAGAASYLAFNGLHWLSPWDRRLFSPSVVFTQVLDVAHLSFQINSLDSNLLWATGTILGYVWITAFFFAVVTNDLDHVRRKLTEFLAFSLWLIAGFALFAFVDTLGGTGLQLRTDTGTVGLRLNLTTIQQLIAGGPVLAALWAAVQWVMRRFSDTPKGKGGPGVSLTLLAGVGAVVVALASFTFLSFCTHLVFRRLGAGAIPPVGTFSAVSSEPGAKLWLLAVILLVLSLIAGHSMTLLNLSSDLQLYTARLTRAYLGASNRRRMNNPGLANVTQPEPNDDVVYPDYHPEKQGGPLHILNVTVNETISGRSNLEQRDRHGFSMALGPVGISTGRFAHSLFADPVLDASTSPSTSPWPAGEGARPRSRTQRLAMECASQAERMRRIVSARVSPLWRRSAHVSPLPLAVFHPLAANPGEPVPHEVEMLSLGQWMAVSGSAFSTGLGQQTSKGFSFLAGFFNVRLGYWWDSQVSPFQRRRHGKLPLGILEWMGLAASEAFPVQSYLLDEFLARFHGPAARQLWNLTDGGHFENTAVYELIRRRVSFIVFCDCGADDEFKFEDVSNLVRKARIDFEAEVTFLPRGEIKSLVPPDVAGCFGALEDFARDDAGHSHAHATLARIDYLDGKSPPGWLLLLKPSLMGDEPVDIREYAAKHPSFPQESTLDQFFDEAQWESYRKLGRLVAEKVFAAALATPQGTPPWRPVDLRAPKNGGVPAASVLS